jgi:hypothetical protein
MDKKYSGYKKLHERGGKISPRSGKKSGKHKNLWKFWWFRELERGRHFAWQGGGKLPRFTPEQGYMFIAVKIPKFRGTVISWKAYKFRENFATKIPNFAVTSRWKFGTLHWFRDKNFFLTRSFMWRSTWNWQSCTVSTMQKSSLLIRWRFS